jgi:hypothetical protein
MAPFIMSLGRRRTQVQHKRRKRLLLKKTLSQLSRRASADLKTAHQAMAPEYHVKSKPAEQYQDKDDEQQNACATIHAMAKSISRATTNATEAAQ